MYLLGLTGAIAAGKTTLTSCAQKLGWHLLDCDVINKEILMNDKNAAQVKDLIDLDQNISSAIFFQEIRKALVESEEKRRVLESYLHPAIFNMIHEKIEYLKLANTDHHSELKILVCMPIISKYLTKTLNELFNHRLSIETHMIYQYKRLIKRYGEENKLISRQLIALHNKEQSVRFEWVQDKKNILWNNSSQEHWIEYSLSYLKQLDRSDLLHK